MTAKVSSGFRKERTEALADGIFATVMTILVLSLVVPTITGMNSVVTLESDLAKLLPDLFAYAITFIFLGVLWIGHQSSLSHIVQFDLRILWLNIILLMGIGLIPFTTALVGRYPLQPIADVAYGINGIAVTTLYNVLWFYPRQQHLTHEEPEAAVTIYRNRILLVGPTVYSLAVIFAFVSAYISLLLYASVSVFYIIFGGRYAHQ
ncbi:MAG TPA: TMEM175 family protein [Candidatus Limnocylindrales bacterium]|nr:TMEM175 family protein [Candidatus Limnocylindrales bacterium]